MAIVTGDPNLDGAMPPGEAGDEPRRAIEGRALRQIAWTRLKRDQWTLIAGATALMYVVVALVAPVLVHFDVHPPELLGSDSAPLPSKGSMSGSHWLGVVPGTGTDLLSRLLYGVTFSVIIGLGATFVAILVGLVIGLLSGFMGGKTASLSSRFTELVLCFPQTLMLLALSNGLIGRLQSMGISNRNVEPAST